MLDQPARHGLLDFDAKAKRAISISTSTSTVEDVGIALGLAFRKALGEMRGECPPRGYASRDGRGVDALRRRRLRPGSYLVWKVLLFQGRRSAISTPSFSASSSTPLPRTPPSRNVENLYGENNHHIAETCFKALARTLRAAVAIDPRQADRIPSTKGRLGD